MTKGVSETVLKHGKVPVMSETSVLKMLGANHISGFQSLVSSSPGYRSIERCRGRVRGEKMSSHFYSLFRVKAYSTPCLVSYIVQLHPLHCTVVAQK